MPQRLCIKCKRRIPRGSWCPDCIARRDAQRTIFEPWRALYATREWSHAQRECLKRDKGQCRGSHGGVRCPASQHLQAHHREPLRALWKQARGDWDVFVALATNVALLAALCPACHAEADRLLRAAG